MAWQGHLVCVSEPVVNPSNSSWRQATTGMVKVAAATVAFALWHSFLCSNGAKNGARALLGKKRGTGLYRAFFMIQALPTSVALFYTVWKQPNRVLYQARGGTRFLGWIVQAFSLAVALAAFFTFDKPKFLGIKGVAELNADLPLDEAQAQGPEIESDGKTRAVGVFRYSRHPLEWALALLFFATPKMKTNWLVFALLNALYSYFGALHEEKRLKKHSSHYENYQKQVAFFFGKSKK